MRPGFCCESVRRCCQSVVRSRSKNGEAEAAFMIFPCCAVPLHQNGIIADTSQKIGEKKKKRAFHANVVKLY